MSKERPDMDYAYERVCEQLGEMKYEDMFSFATGIALGLLDKDDDATVVKVCETLLSTATAHLEANLPETSDKREQD